MQRMFRDRVTSSSLKCFSKGNDTDNKSTDIRNTDIRSADNRSTGSRNIDKRNTGKGNKDNRNISYKPMIHINKIVNG